MFEAILTVLMFIGVAGILIHALIFQVLLSIEPHDGIFASFAALFLISFVGLLIWFPN